MSNGLITPPWGAPSSVGVNRPSSITPAFSHWRTSPRAGNVPSDSTDVIMVEPVECRRQVGVEHPQTLRVGAARRRVDGHDRVVAATTRPKAVGLRLEPGLPLGLQRVDRQGLQRPVGDHGNPERAAAPVALGHIHPLDRTRRPRLGAVLHPVGQFGLLRRGHHDLPVHPGRLAASVELRHPPHRHQSVAAGAEHQLLQIPDLLQVPIPRRREDPLPQPPYCPPRRDANRWRPSPEVRPRVRSPREPPSPRVAKASVVMASNLSLRFRCLGQPSSAGSPDPRQHPFRSGHQPLSGRLCGNRRRRSQHHRSRFPVAFRPPAFASRVVLRPPGHRAILTVDLPAGSILAWTPSGLSRSA